MFAEVNFYDAVDVATDNWFYVSNVVSVGLKFGKIGDKCGFCNGFAMRHQQLKPLSEGKRALKRTESLAILAMRTAAAKIAIGGVQVLKSAENP